MPQFDSSVLASGKNERQLGMKRHRGDVLQVALQRLHTSLVLVVPDLDSSIVRTRDKVRLVATVVVVDTVDALLVAFEREVGMIRAQLPHFDGLVERGAREGVVIFRVDHDLHDVVSVALEDLLAGPLVIPVPELDGHVVTARQQVRLSRVNGETADVVRVSLEHVHSLECVVVVGADLHIVRACHDPVLAWHEFGCAHRRLTHLECLD